MGWLDRLFGHHEDAEAEHKSTNAQPDSSENTPPPPERTGLNGEYDQNGLAKRVAKSFDVAGLSDHQTVWIAQRGTTVVLKGTCRDRTLLTKMVEIAKQVNGASAVETDQVRVESSNV